MLREENVYEEREREREREYKRSKGTTGHTADHSTAAHGCSIICLNIERMISILLEIFGENTSKKS